MRIEGLYSRELVTAELADTLFEAAGRMSAKRVSSLPVLREGRPVGILTERDLTQAVAEGADPRQSPVASFMGLEPAVALVDEDSVTVANRILSLGVRHLPWLRQARWWA